MKKVIVIGSPGAGKSVFSKKLSEVTKIPLYHIDMMYHNADGTHISREELKEKFKKIFNEEKWIIDGNYQKTIEMRLKECDTVFLLDFPTEVCIKGAESRVGKKREDMPWTKKNLTKLLKKPLSISKMKNCLKFIRCWTNIKKVETLLFLNLGKKQINLLKK